MNIEENQSAAEKLKTAGENVAWLYEKYQALRQLAQPLNNLPPSAPLPEGVNIFSITVDYILRDGKRTTADISSARLRVGDLATMLEAEMEAIVNSMRNISSLAKETAAQIETACEAAQYNARAQRVGGPS